MSSAQRRNTETLFCFRLLKKATLNLDLAQKCLSAFGLFPIKFTATRSRPFHLTLLGTKQLFEFLLFKQPPQPHAHFRRNVAAGPDGEVIGLSAAPSIERAGNEIGALNAQRHRPCG
jgi:hypothetical protein